MDRSGFQEEKSTGTGEGTRCGPSSDLSRHPLLRRHALLFHPSAYPAHRRNQTLDLLRLQRHHRKNPIGRLGLLRQAHHCGRKDLGRDVPHGPEVSVAHLELRVSGPQRPGPHGLLPGLDGDGSGLPGYRTGMRPESAKPAIAIAVPVRRLQPVRQRFPSHVQRAERTVRPVSRRPEEGPHAVAGRHLPKTCPCSTCSSRTCASGRSPP